MRSPRLLLFLLCLPLVSTVLRAQDSHAVTKADVDRWMVELSNWGRWGKDDQLGALNFITPAKRRQAAALVREGFSVSLSHETLTERTPENPSPYNITWTLRGPQFASDNISISYHGYAHTHMDSLCHMAFEHKIFNGFPDEIVAGKGCAQDAISSGNPLKILCSNAI